MGILETLLQTAQQIQADYERVTKQLIDAQRELQLLKEDKFVDFKWVCWYLGVSKETAVDMLAEESIFVYGRQVKRFKRSDIIRFADRHCIKVKNLYSVAPPTHRRRQL